jgi:outer membrane immunogenic protein
MAADMPVKAPPPAPVVYYDWSGIYGGFSIGWMSYDVQRDFTGPFHPVFVGGGRGNFTTSDSDAVFGGHIGAQWQWGPWVLGVEGSWSGCWEECQTNSGLLPTPLFLADRTGHHKITNLFTVGPRLGFAWDRFMFFVTGGWASADLKGGYCRASDGFCFAGGLAQSGESRNDGWYAGGGFDWMVHKGPLVDVILGVEYQHFDVGSESAHCFNPGCIPDNRDYSLSASGDIVRARLTIKTGGYGILWR